MLYYWHPVSDYVICQVWREGSHWEWAIVGFLVMHPARRPLEAGARMPRPPLIWKRGTGGTMNEACYYCEAALPDDAYEQMQMALP